MGEVGDAPENNLGVIDHRPSLNLPIISFSLSNPTLSPISSIAFPLPVSKDSASTTLLAAFTPSPSDGPKTLPFLFSGVYPSHGFFPATNFIRSTANRSAAARCAGDRLWL